MNFSRHSLSCAVLISSGITFILATPSITADSVSPHHEPDQLILDEARENRKLLLPVIHAIQKKYHIPAISLVVVRAQQTVWAEGFGHANRGKRIEATANTVYRGGSLAKPFTALAIMKLTEDETLDIDQPVFSYLPGFSIHSRFDVTAEPITLRNILCHHSGLPSDLNKGMWTDQDFTEVSKQLKEEYTAYPPNMIFSYSNIGYTLLGHIIENSQALSYENYMIQNIFEPLKMYHTSLQTLPETKPVYALGYKNNEPQPLLPIRDIPAFGLMTSVNDLGQFIRLLLASHDSPVVMKETLEEILEPQNMQVALDINIINSLGWFLEENTVLDDSTIIRHGGTTLYFSSEMIIAPEKGIGVAVMANASGSRKIVSKLAEELLKIFTLKNKAATSSLIQLEPVKRLLEMDESAPIEGDYATDLGVISIRAQDDRTCGCIASETFDLIPYPNGWLGINPESVDSLPPAYKMLTKLKYKTRIIDDMEVMIAKNGDKEMVLGKKIALKKIPDTWKQRVGVYRINNPDLQFPVTETELLIKDGRLYMKYKMPLLSESIVETPIQPISDNEAIILGLGRTRGETIRAFRKNGREHVHYSGFNGTKIIK